MSEINTPKSKGVQDRYTLGTPLKATACIIFTPFFTAVYNQEGLILDNLCCKQGNSSIKSSVYNQEGF